MIFSFVLINAAINGLPDGEAHRQIATKTSTQDVALFLINESIRGIRQGDVLLVVTNVLNVAEVIADEFRKILLFLSD